MAGTACDNGPKARNGAESLAATQNLAKRLAVVVVTYRRQHLLGELFDSLAELTTHPWRIYVVDNENSQDTQTRVRDFGERLADAWGEPDDGAERVVYLPQPTDVGGSAGFNAGMKRAYHDGAEWFWLMDDDVAARHRGDPGAVDGRARRDPGRAFRFLRRGLPTAARPQRRLRHPGAVAAALRQGRVPRHQRRVP